MSVWDVVGNVGGIQQVFLVVSAFFLSYYSRINFVIEATNAMFKIQYKDDKLKLEDE